jgi:sulfonate transport system ATP-binding protein
MNVPLLRALWRPELRDEPDALGATDKANAPAGLHIRIASKHYGAREVLRHIDLRLNPGEIISLTGASGCGKSTLLRIVAGLERDYRGGISLDGEKLEGIDERVRFIFQEPRLLPWLNVAANVAFAEDDGKSQAAVAASPHVRQLLAEVGLLDYSAALPKELSGGQAQRVAIARGLFRQPRVLLLDEPFSAVDAFTRIKLQELLLRLADEHGFTVLLVTHDVDEAIHLSDRVLVIGDGRISAEIPVHAARPRERHHESVAIRDARTALFSALHAAHVF